MDMETLTRLVRREIDLADAKLDDENEDRQYILENLIQHVRVHLDMADGS